MPYEPTIWQVGDVITAEKLNKIEQALVTLYGGSSEQSGVVIVQEQSVTLTENDHFATLSPVNGYLVPNDLPDDWTVVVGEHTLVYDDITMGGPAYLYGGADEGVMYIVAIDQGVIAFAVYGQSGTVAGTYTISITAEDANIVQVPEGYIILAPEQTVALTTNASEAILDLVVGASVSAIGNDWIVIADGNTLELVDTGSEYQYSYIDSNTGYDYYVVMNSPGNVHFGVTDGHTVPGEYTVTIFIPDPQAQEETPTPEPTPISEQQQ